MSGGIKLAPLLTEIKVDIASFKSDMEEAKTLGIEKAEEISKALSGTAKVGEQLKVGAVLTKSVTAPLVGAGTASVKLAVDFEDSMAKVSTIADTTKVPISQLKEGILDLSSETGESASELNEALYQAISASVDTADAVDFLHVATMAAVGGFTDNTTAVNGLTTVLNSYGMEAKEVEKIANQMLITQNLGKTSFGELAASMGQVTPVAASLGVTTEELFSSLAVTTAQGLGTSESITALKGAMSNIIKPTSEASKAAEALGIDFSVSALQTKGWMGFMSDLRTQLKQAAPEYANLSDKVADGTKKLEAMEKVGKKNTDEYKRLKKEVSNSTKEMEAIAQASDSTIGGFATMFGSVEGLNSVLMLTSEQGMQKYNEAMKQMGTNTTALRSAYDKMDKAPGRQMQKALNDIKNAGIEMGDKILPVISDVIGDIRKLVGRFSELSDEQQENILKWAGIAAAAGPAMSILGNGITTFTSLAKVIGGASSALGVVGSTTGFAGALVNVGALFGPVALGATAVGTGIYAIHEQGQLMNRTVLDSEEDLSLMELALAKLQGVEVKSKKELEELGFVHKEFSDKISPEFQRAVQDSTEKVQEFNVFLQEIGFDNVITQEESDEFNSRVEAMCNEAINTIQSKKEESQSALKDLFIADDQVIDESEQKVLEILSKSSESQIEEVTALKAEILAIKQKAVEEGRELNEQEIADIESKWARINQIELEALGGTQEEIAYAKNEFNARIKTMDLESASSLMQEKAQIRDEEIIQIQAAYDTQIEMLKTKAEECTGAEKAELETQIANLEADRQTKIDMQNQLWDDYMGIIREKNPAIVDEINRFNGEILTNGDKNNQEALREMMSHYDGLAKITESGCYQIWDKNESMWKDVAVTVDANTKEITAMYEQSGRDFAGYTEQMAEDAKNMANEQTGAYEKIGASMGLYMGHAGEIRDANGNVVASMDDLTEHTDGTRRGIVDINGTPYEIRVNKDGTISALNEISKAADNAARDRTIHIAAQYMNNPSYAAYNGVKADKYGWHNFNGIDSVPFDGYQATLHKGERVLTAEENKEYSAGQGNVDYNAIRSIVRSELKGIVIELNDREMGRAYSRYAQERR